jgi:hypothetical protein
MGALYRINPRNRGQIGERSAIGRISVLSDRRAVPECAAIHVDLPRNLPMRIAFATAAMLAAFVSAPAHAAYVSVDYSGSFLAGGGGTAPPGVAPGAVITYHAVFDMAKLTDVTVSGNNAINANVPMLHPGLTPVDFSSIMTASLWDDPLASIGSETYSKGDALGRGTPYSDTSFDLGVGDYPIVEFLNGQFAGIGGVFLNADGVRLLTDPIAFREGLLPPAFSFVIQAPGGFGGVGRYDAATATFRAVPEPVTWSMMIVGFGFVGTVLRRRKRRAMDIHVTALPRGIGWALD